MSLLQKTLFPYIILLACSAEGYVATAKNSFPLDYSTCLYCLLILVHVHRSRQTVPVLLRQNHYKIFKSRKENPQKLTQLSSRSHPRHLVGKRTAQKDTITDITSDSQVNSNFPYRWSPASLTFNNYFYLFLYLYIT